MALSARDIALDGLWPGQVTAYSVAGQGLIPQEAEEEIEAPPVTVPVVRHGGAGPARLPRRLRLLRRVSVEAEAVEVWWETTAVASRRVGAGPVLAVQVADTLATGFVVASARAVEVVAEVETSADAGVKRLAPLAKVARLAGLSSLAKPVRPV